jgi:hypothetical protein
MKKSTTLLTVIAALALTVACTTKQPASDDITAMPTEAQTTSDFAADPAPTTKTAAAPVKTPDETSKVASLGASSSGRSR